MATAEKVHVPIVSALDAADGGAGGSGTRHGAFCLAGSAARYDEIQQVSNAITLRGMARALPPLLQGAHGIFDARRDMPFTLRSHVLRLWFEGSVE